MIQYLSFLLICALLIAPAHAGRLADPVLKSPIDASHPLREQRNADLDRETEHFQKHFGSFARYVYNAIDPITHIATSFPEERRLQGWAVSYDNAIRIMFLARAGHIGEAEAAMKYFMTQDAIKKNGWILNIIDAQESRAGGRAVEHIMHAGPNVYFGSAALTLYSITGSKKYLDFAKERWELIHSLQNTDPKSFNYGGISMGPWGEQLLDQRIGFSLNNPSWAQVYNTEHNADFAGFTKALMSYDPKNHARYEETVRLIGIWAKKVYDPKMHVFHMGALEKEHPENNSNKASESPVFPEHPLDSSALMISAFGYDGIEALKLEPTPGVPDRMRAAIDENYRVEVTFTTPEGKQVNVWGYDFLSHKERKECVLTEERGIYGDEKVQIGIGREALLSDEWSSWVAFADLALADDLARKGKVEQARYYYDKYKENALVQGVNTGVNVGPDLVAYPYSHPIPYSYNKPVGFGWNTPHESFGLIGGMCRFLGMVGHDPLRAGGNLAVSFRLPIYPTGEHPEEKYELMVYTEAEDYINKAWDLINNSEWEKALAMIDRLHREHPEWAVLAKEQEKVAAKEPDFPLRFRNKLTALELTPVYQKYWALYHIGAGEFIRLRAAVQLDQERVAVNAMKHLLRDYAHAQAFDTAGWMWQIKESALNEFNIEYVRATEELNKEMLAQNPE